ncbi:MAG: 2,3-dimethylmalate dehydratase small subunit [Burkholderiaceae bacterium]|nr:2,3-dimethylmalate dehydratase small subunit [Burkholderiaceae bacterium]
MDEAAEVSRLLRRGRRAAAVAGHRVWRLPADVDTDALAPGRWMKYGAEVIAQHCLESLRPQFALQARPGDVIVAGANFGIGSSREQAASALTHLGIAAVIAPSYGGFFFRNAFNVGLPLLTCRDAEAIGEGERVAFDLPSATVRCVADADGRALGARGPLFCCEPIPQFLLDMVRAGGLLPQLKAAAATRRRDARA